MKIKELTLSTTDLLSTEKFYAEVLNFKIQVKYSKKKIPLLSAKLCLHLFYVKRS